MPRPDPSAVSANAYSIAYRLLGDRSAAHAAVGIAVERVERAGGIDRPEWLALVAGATVAEAVGVAAVGADPAVDGSSDGSLRGALRRRLASASDDERVAGALHHLAGYPVDAVAAFMQRDASDVVRLAGAIAPPPGVSYRDLGDPELVQRGAVAPSAPRRRVSASTVVSVVVIVGLVLGASRCVGARPSLGPALPTVPVSVGPAEPARPSKGCSAPQTGGVMTGVADAESGPVTYRLAVPDGAATPQGTSSTPRPLLLVVADAGQSVEAASATDLEPRALAQGQLVVTVAPTDAGTVAALDGAGAVLDAALGATCVDLSRVTATGLGTGGQVATALGCTRSDVVGVVVAVGGGSLPDGCEISPAASLLLLWAADDVVFPPTGGYGPQAPPLSSTAAPLPPTPAGQIAEDWARQIDAGAPQRTAAPDGTSTEDAVASSGAAVRWVAAPTGGHAWGPAITDAVLSFAAEHARSS